MLKLLFLAFLQTQHTADFHEACSSGQIQVSTASMFECGYANQYGTTTPATCTIGDRPFYDTDGAAGSRYFICTATDTWTAIDDSGTSTVRWDQLTAPTAATLLTSNDTSETATFSFTSNYGADQFIVKQITGNPTAGHSFVTYVTDADTKPFGSYIGGGTTNGVYMDGSTGVMQKAGSGSVLADNLTCTGCADAADLAADSCDTSEIAANAVTASELANDAVDEAALKAVDSASDEDVCTYETTTGDFEWHSRDEIVAGISAGALPNDSVLEADLKAVDAASDEDVCTYESTTGDFEWHSASEIAARFTEGALPDDSVVEADLKAVDAASDEECLTYETTTGDFEWQSCDAASGDVTDVFDCASGNCASITTSDGDYLNFSATDDYAVTSGLFLPQDSDWGTENLPPLTPTIGAEGRIGWDTDDDWLFVSDGTIENRIGPDSRSIALYQSVLTNVVAGTNPYSTGTTLTNLGTSYVTIGGIAVAESVHLKGRLIWRAATTGAQTGTFTCDIYDAPTATSVVSEAFSSSSSLTTRVGSWASLIVGRTSDSAVELYLRCKDSVSADDPVLAYAFVELSY